MDDGSFNFAKCTNNQCTEHVPTIWFTEDMKRAVQNDDWNTVFECPCDNIFTVLNSRLFKGDGEWNVKKDGEFGERVFVPFTQSDSEGTIF